MEVKEPRNFHIIFYSLQYSLLSWTNAKVASKNLMREAARLVAQQLQFMS